MMTTGPLEGSSAGGDHKPIPVAGNPRHRFTAPQGHTALPGNSATSTARTSADFRVWENFPVLFGHHGKTAVPEKCDEVFV